MSKNILLQGKTSMIFHSGNYNKYALYCVAFCLAVFVFLGADNFVAPAVCALLLAICIPVLLLIRGDGKYYCRIAVKVILSALAGIFIASSARVLYFLPAQELLSEYSGASCEMLVEIKSISSKGDTYANYDAVILSADGKSVRSEFGVYPKIRVTDFSDDELSAGEVVKLAASISAPQEVTQSGFREKKHLESRCIFISCTAESQPELVSVRKPGLVKSIRDKMSSGISKYIGKYRSGYESAFSKCMLLGDKSGVDGYLKDIFRASGISHILSVSGLHLSVLLYTVSYVFGVGRNRKRRRFPGAEVVSCIIALTYMAIADFTPSIMRAGFMMIITNLFGIYKYYSQKFAKPGFNDNVKYESFNGISSLFCATAVICVVSPYSVYDIGMQLSFLSTLGIILVMPVYQRYRRRYIPLVLQPFVASLLITLSALSFTFPVCVYNFGTLSSVTALSNLLITPIVTPLLALLLLLALFSLLPQGAVVIFICSALGKICGFLSSLCIKIAEKNSSFLYSNLYAKDNFVINIIFSALVISAVLFAIYRYEKVSLMLCAFTAGLFLMCFCTYFGETALYHSQTRLNVSSDGDTPYVCAQTGDTRVYFDSASALFESPLMRDVINEETYDTHNVYCALVSGSTDLEVLYCNIMKFDDSCGADVLLLPVPESVTDKEKYTALVALLSKNGFDIELYESGFTIGKTDYKVKNGNNYSSIEFSKYSVVFSDTYSDKLTASLSEDAEYCVYFCKNAGATSNENYSSGAKLYVPSPYYKSIKGANGITARKVTVFS